MPERIRRVTWSDSGRRKLKQEMRELKEFAATFIEYPTEDDQSIIDFCLLPVVGLQWKANPIWAQIIGAPGSGKTLHLDLLKDYDEAQFVSRISKNSLISGYRGDKGNEEDPSLLPLLNDKIFVIKDFTTILQAPREERDAVVGQLRDIFDGSTSRALGNIKGVQEYTSWFTMLLAVTPAIDQYHSINQQLGERFISYRVRPQNREALGLAAIRNTINGHDSTNMDELRKRFQTFAKKLPKVGISDVKWSEDTMVKIASYCDFIALCRSHARREQGGVGLSSIPDQEVGTRLASQIVQCMAAYCVINGLEEPNEQAWKFISRILHDTLPTYISWVLYNCYAIHRTSPNFGENAIRIRSKLGPTTVNQVVTDMHYNGIFHLQSASSAGNNSKYCLTDKALTFIESSGIFNHIEDEDTFSMNITQYTKAKERSSNV